MKGESCYSMPKAHIHVGFTSTFEVKPILQPLNSTKNVQSKKHCWNMCLFDLSFFRWKGPGAKAKREEGIDFFLKLKTIRAME